MLYVKLKKITILTLVAFLASSILFATASFAQLLPEYQEGGGAPASAIPSYSSSSYSQAPTAQPANWNGVELDNGASRPVPATSTSSSRSGLFNDLTRRGADIFIGMREIIYAVAGFGIVAVAIGGFFGNFNWKWLGAIIIGLMVIALTGGILDYMVEDHRFEGKLITDTLRTGDDGELPAPEGE